MAQAIVVVTLQTIAARELIAASLRFGLKARFYLKLEFIENSINLADIPPAREQVAWHWNSSMMQGGVTV